MSPRPPPPASLACALPRRARRALGELLADVGQHDRGQDREELLDQVTAAAPCPASAEATALLSLPPKKVSDGCRPPLVHLIDVDPAVEQAALTLLFNSRFELARVDVVRLDVLRQPADECGTKVLMALFTSP